MANHNMENQLYKPPKEQPVDELRFVLYARKSTEDEGSQINSIEDQIKVCKGYAESRGDINIVDIVREETSAKRAGNRPKFDEMLRGFNKKYDGLIAYHPDRLARNMREAGVVIDMLNPDNGLIKHLAFPTVQFTNDSSGRLTLAVLFSLATQYSEHLSEMVKRGVDSNFQKGKSSVGICEQTGQDSKKSSNTGRKTMSTAKPKSLAKIKKCEAFTLRCRPPQECSSTRSTTASSANPATRSIYGSSTTSSRW